MYLHFSEVICWKIIVFFWWCHVSLNFCVSCRRVLRSVPPVKQSPLPTFWSGLGRKRLCSGGGGCGSYSSKAGSVSTSPSAAVFSRKDGSGLTAVGSYPRALLGCKLPRASWSGTPSRAGWGRIEAALLQWTVAASELMSFWLACNSICQTPHPTTQPSWAAQSASALWKSLSDFKLTDKKSWSTTLIHFWWECKWGGQYCNTYWKSLQVRILQ